MRAPARGGRGGGFGGRGGARRRVKGEGAVARGSSMHALRQRWWRRDRHQFVKERGKSDVHRRCQPRSTSPLCAGVQVVAEAALEAGAAAGAALEGGEDSTGSQRARRMVRKGRAGPPKGAGGAAERGTARRAGAGTSVYCNRQTLLGSRAIGPCKQQHQAAWPCCKRGAHAPISLPLTHRWVLALPAPRIFAEVVEAGTYMHPCEGEMVCKLTNTMVRPRPAAGHTCSRAPAPRAWLLGTHS